MTSSLHETFDSTLLLAHSWDMHWQDTYSHLADPGTVPARVLRAERGLYEVMTAHGPDRVQLLGSPGIGHGLWPTTGDWISMVPATPSTAAHLASVLPRRTLLARATVGGNSQEQALAANVDTVVVAVSLASPLRHSRTERLLALAWASGATPVVALTKADTHPDPDSALEELGSVALGIQIVATSAETEEGLDDLRAAISGTVALIGPSGAGKSSLGNRLLGADLLATGEVRAVDGKGRHTTAWRELLPMPGGGVLLDTPGLRSERLAQMKSMAHQQRAFAKERGLSKNRDRRR